VCVLAYSERGREPNGGGFFFFKIDWRRGETEMWLCREREKDMTESRLKGGFVLKRGDFFFF
jgi:hypothetical protein